MAEAAFSIVVIAQAVRAIGWSLVLIALIVVAFLVVMRLRTWLQSDDGDAAPSIGFTLGDLRRLHKEGKMTDEEFERARAKMMAGAKAMAEKLPDPLAGSRKRKEEKN
jgi:hypothetical protein